VSGPPRRLGSRLHLRERQPRVIKECSPGRGQFDAVHTAAHQLNADLVFEIADLPAQRRLRGVQPFLGRERKAAFLGNRDEIAKMP